MRVSLAVAGVFLFSALSPLAAEAASSPTETDQIKDLPANWLKPGEFKGKKILVVTWYSEGGREDSVPLDHVPRILRKMGFAVDVQVSPEHLPRLDGYDQLWMLSGLGGAFGAADVERIKGFLGHGHGVYVLSDNTPYIHEGAVLGKALYGIDVEGDYIGQQMIHVVAPGTVARLVAEAARSGDLGKLAELRRAGYLNGKLYAEDHELLSGIERIYEGVTICHFGPSPDLDVILRASDNQSLVAVSKRKSENLLFDCGFTRMYFDWDAHADTATRWYQNVAAYLAGKRRHDLPPTPASQTASRQ